MSFLGPQMDRSRTLCCGYRFESVAGWSGDGWRALDERNGSAKFARAGGPLIAAGRTPERGAEMASIGYRPARPGAVIAPNLRGLGDK